MSEKAKKDHNILFNIIKTIVRPFFCWPYHYKIKGKYRIAKGESVVVLSNHQTDLDPYFISLSFNKNLHAIATDNIFKKGLVSKALRFFGAIPKKKGVVDLKSNMEMMNVVSHKGSILIFPEGNRSYAEFQYYIAPNFSRMMKTFGSTIVLFNLHGGTGTHPRFAKKNRKGPFFGEIKAVLRYEDYKDIKDEELNEIIVNGLRVIDSESGNLYKSKAKAEYLERALFVCPICQTPNQLASKGDYLNCSNCGLSVKFNEDLSLSSDNSNFTYHRLLPWYNFQKKWIRDLEIKNDDNVIFADDDVKLKNANPFEERKVITKGKMEVTSKELRLPDVTFNVKDIAIASPVSGTKLCFSVGENSYQICGNKRFNPLKYVFLFNKLDTMMKNKKVDKYFRLEEDEK